MIERYEVPAPCLKENKTVDSVDILAAVGHEIRNPLNAIIGLSQLLYSTNSMAEVKNYTEGLMQTSEHLMEIVNNLLDFSKLRTGRLEMNLKPVALKESLISQLSGQRLVAEGKGLTFFVDIDKSIPTTVVLDSLKLSQVVLNLISNSIKFTDTGSVGLRVVLIRKTNSDIQLLFSVEDTGIGISKEHLKKIFQAFNQGDGDTNLLFGGTGLGLTISKQLVEALGGNLVVESAPGKGSKFSFTISALIQKQKDIQPLTPNSWESLKELRILLVDDSEMNCMIVRRFLETKEMLCTTAGNGAAALELMENHDFDIILTDLKMPRMDGYEFIRRIQEKESVHHHMPPVIALTGSLYGQEGEELRNQGFSGYLLKPFGPEQLFSAIFKEIQRLPGNCR